MQRQSYDRVKDLNYPNPTQRRGSTAAHPAQLWTPTVHAFLRHLEAEKFEAAPRVIDSGFDEDGNELVSWLEGTIFAESMRPNPQQGEAEEDPFADTSAARCQILDPGGPTRS